MSHISRLMQFYFVDGKMQLAQRLVKAWNSGYSSKKMWIKLSVILKSFELYILNNSNKNVISTHLIQGETLYDIYSYC